MAFIQFFIHDKINILMTIDSLDMKKILPLALLLAAHAAHADDHDPIRKIMSCDESFFRQLASLQAQHPKQITAVTGGIAQLKMDKPVNNALAMEEAMPGSSKGSKEFARTGNFSPVSLSPQWTLTQYNESHSKFNKQWIEGVGEVYSWTFHVESKKNMSYQDIAKLDGNIKWNKCEDRSCLFFQQPINGKWQAVKAGQLVDKPYLQRMIFQDDKNKFSISCTLRDEGKVLPAGMIKTRRSDWVLNF
ncbi:hypothetical protein LQD23_05555 [Chromobacterium violaceum]|uniref:hypothetical protein n=1 Tax=Chromobacterium violaceum TaxID=536 RepID=UPI001E367D8C|nr:hypothetical protein [Chromobacterium violaceum]MCD0491758.1 hypothetical protein [Chromobacterium violaceum]